MRDLTVDHPTAVLEIRDRLPLRRSQALFEVAIHSAEAVDWAKELRNHPEVRSVEPLDTTHRGATLRVLSSGKTFIPLIQRLKLLRQHPYPVRNGVATWTVAGPEARIRRLWERLGAAHVPFRLESIRRGATPEATGGLTPRQHEILRRAFDEGYFDRPPRVSLTGLAVELGVATSTLSAQLTQIEKRVIEAHLAALGRGRT